MHIYPETDVGEILEKVDENMMTESSRSEIEMTITIKDTSPRTFSFISFTKGNDYAFFEYTAPAREKGTKFLKQGKSMWLYFPASGRTRQIRGHMLRQGMMGSDFSYEDISEDVSIIDNYTYSLIEETKYEERMVYKIALDAKENVDVAYQKMIIWVDTEWYVPLKEELYARSGILLKEFFLSDIKLIDEKPYPMYMKMINKLSNDSYTEIKIKDIQIGIKLDESIFSLSNLTKP